MYEVGYFIRNCITIHSYNDMCIAWTNVEHPKLRNAELIIKRAQKALTNEKINSKESGCFFENGLYIYKISGNII